MNEQQKALEEAMVKCGNTYESFAKQLGITKQAVAQFMKTGNVTAERAVQIEHVSGVQRERLRPDIFDRSFKPEFKTNRHVVSIKIPTPKKLVEAMEGKPELAIPEPEPETIYNKPKTTETIVGEVDKDLDDLDIEELKKLVFKGGNNE